MLFFGKKKKESSPAGSYDSETMEPALRSSICTGEKVAGFQNKQTGAFLEVMLIRSNSDLEDFRREYGITGEIKTFY